MSSALERFHLRHVVWLLAALAMVAAPHIERLPVWITLLVIMLFAWRGYTALYGLALPRKWMLLLIAAGALGGIYISYGRILGRDSGIALLVVMLGLKLMEMAALRDAMILIFIAYFLVITNFLYSQTIPTMVFMLFAVWIITATMIGFQFRVRQPGYRYQLRTAGVMLLQAAPLMLVFFLLFPRVQGPLWGMPQDAYSGVTGLSDEMSPGSVSNLLTSDAVAFRVNFDSATPPATQQLYWRGPVMWDFDGRTWSAPRIPYALPRTLDSLDGAVEYAVTMEPHGKRWLFALDLPGKTPPRSMMTNDFQLLFQGQLTNRMRYDMISYLRYRDAAELPRYELQRALRLPAGANPRTRDLAKEMHKRATDDRAYVNAVLGMLRNQNFSYTTTPPLLGPNPVDEFLFTTLAGYCEHYASAFTVLMRAAGVPARVVTGYQGGEFNAVGNYMIVRQADAHAWVEVWLGSEGWTRVDPTAAVAPTRVQSGAVAAVPQGESVPLLLRGNFRWLHRAGLAWDSLANSWNQVVLGYAFDRQRQLMQRIGVDDATWQSMATVMFMATGAIMLVLALLMLRKLRAQRPDPVAAVYARFCQRLARRGLTRHPSEGPAAFSKRAATAHPELAAAIKTISDLYIRLRYGNEARPAEIGDLRRAVAAFRPRTWK
jgi:transglutaminase-like putative cysteine protease